MDGNHHEESTLDGGKLQDIKTYSMPQVLVATCPSAMQHQQDTAQPQTRTMPITAGHFSSPPSPPSSLALPLPNQKFITARTDSTTRATPGRYTGSMISGKGVSAPQQRTGGDSNLVKHLQGWVDGRANRLGEEGRKQDWEQTQVG